MPLPNAKPDPAGSNVYRQLNSIKLGDLTNEQFDKVYQNVFLNDMSEDELRRLALVGAARQSFSASSSGPIPETSVTAFIEATNSGTRYNIFQPNQGEVWLLGPCSFQVGGGSGSVSVEQWLYAGDNIDGTTRRVLVGNSSSSSSSYSTIYEGGPNMPIHVDSNGYVAVEATGTFTTVSFFLHLIRVR